MRPKNRPRDVLEALPEVLEWRSRQVPEDCYGLTDKVYLDLLDLLESNRKAFLKLDKNVNQWALAAGFLEDLAAACRLVGEGRLPAAYKEPGRHLTPPVEYQIAFCSYLASGGTDDIHIPKGPRPQRFTPLRPGEIESLVGPSVWDAYKKHIREGRRIAVLRIGWKWDTPTMAGAHAVLRGFIGQDVVAIREALQQVDKEVAEAKVGAEAAARRQRKRAEAAEATRVRRERFLEEQKATPVSQRSPEPKT